MERTTGHTDVLSETGELITSFSTTIPETGEQVSMEVRPSGDPLNVGVALRGVLADIEARIDKTEIQPFTIRTEKEREDVANALIEDKREIAYVENSLKKFADLAFTIHRTITGKRNEYQSYAKQRADTRDAAITEYALEQAKREEAENARLREVARQEEEARRKAEAEELRKRAATEKRPDLVARAKEVENAPVREIAISSRGGGGALKSRVRGSEGGSVGLAKKYNVDITDADALILATARRHIYREVIDLLLKEFAGKKRQLLNGAAVVEPLRAALEDLPQIPLTILEPVEQKIKESAKATNGKINWPGVAISEDYGTRVRR